MAEDPGLEIVKASAEGAATGLVTPVVQAARAMVAAVLGDTVEALDEYAATRITLRNELGRQRLIETMALSLRMCEEAGIEPSAVGLKIVRPILEHAAVEVDDESMHARWAALLANAAAGDAGADVWVAFPEILAQLEPIEALALEWLATQPAGTDLPTFLEQFGYSGIEGCDFRTPSAHVENLTRLGLCEMSGMWGGERSVDQRDALPPKRNVDLTALGSAFLRACSPPSGAHTGAHEP